VRDHGRKIYYRGGWHFRLRSSTGYFLLRGEDIAFGDKGRVMRESQIEAYFVKRVKEVGGISFKFTSPGVRGVPDRIVIYKVKVYFVELKAPGKTLRADQVRIHKRIILHGANCRVISTKEEVDLFIGELE